jgi:hypothetical protein
MLCLQHVLLHTVPSVLADPGTTEMWIVSALEKQRSIRCILGLQEAVCTGATRACLSGFFASACTLVAIVVVLRSAYAYMYMCSCTQHSVCTGATRALLVCFTSACTHVPHSCDSLLCLHSCASPQPALFISACSVISSNASVTASDCKQCLQLQAVLAAAGASATDWRCLVRLQPKVV